MEKTILFDPPVEITGEKPLDKIVMREPKVADMRAVDRMEGGELDKEVAMIARLTGINIEDLDGFSARQYQQLQKEYAAFFDVAGQETGRKSGASA